MKLYLKSLGLSVILAVSCGKNATPSQVKHDVNEPVRKQAKAWLWANETEDEYLAMGNPSDLTSLLPGKQFLPADHVMTKRLQGWLDELDAKVRSNDPERMAMVPKPVIRIQLTADANAFVTAIPVCFDNVSIRFNGSRNSGNRNGKRFIALPDDGQIIGGAVEEGRTPFNTPECRHITLTASELAERLAFLNETVTGCQLKMTTLRANKFEVIANSKCTLQGSLENAADAAVFGMLATARHVTFFSGMLKLSQMGEAEVVAILAHELGHYYRPHIASGTAHYNFAYDASALNPSERPVPKQGTEYLKIGAEESTSLFGVMKSRISDLRTNIPKDKLHSISGSTVHPTMLPVLRGLIQLYSTSDVADCASSNQLAQSMEKEGVLAPFFVPITKVSDEIAKVVVKFEESAKSCLAKIDLKDDTVLPNAVEAVDSATGGSKFARAAAKPILTEGTLLDWINRIDAKVKVDYESAMIDPATPFSLEKIYEAAMARRKAITQSQAIAKEFIDQKLGLYTGEQEADELAVEWTNELGLDVHTSGNLGMAFLKAFESDDAFNTCNEKRSNGWTEADGSVSFVAWNDILLDPHPASCYRVRDSDLEVKAHGYKNPANGPRKVATTAEWKALTDTIPEFKSSSDRGLRYNSSASGILAAKPRIGCRFDHQHKH